MTNKIEDFIKLADNAAKAGNIKRITAWQIVQHYPALARALLQAEEALEDCQMIATGYCAALGTSGDKIKKQFWYENADQALATIQKIKS